MRRRFLVIATVGLSAASLAGWAVFLSGQGLERADQWVSVVGFFVNVLLTTVSLGLAWWTLRPPAHAVDELSGVGAVRIGGNSSGRISTTVTGAASAGGAGSVSVAGDSTATVTTRVAVDPASSW